MLAGSLLLHLLALVAVWWARPVKPPETNSAASDEVAMVFESPGAKQASVQGPAAIQASSAPTGSMSAPSTQPNPDTTPPQPQAPPTPTPPQPTPPPPPAPTPPLPETQPQPETPPPTPAAPPPVPTPPPETPHPPPTVSLSEGDEPAPPPPFVVPQPPLPLPPLPPVPRPVAPRRYFARSSPQSSLSAPQDWSLNSVPRSAPGRASRGVDFSTNNLPGQTDSTLGYVSGARPSGDWIGALKRWVQARTYYPEGALDQGQRGAVTVEVVIDRSGRVLSSTLVRSARSPFLDMGFLGEWRGATTPSFTPDMTEQTTTIVFTMNYILNGQR